MCPDLFRFGEPLNQGAHKGLEVPTPYAFGEPLYLYPEQPDDDDDGYEPDWSPPPGTEDA